MSSSEAALALALVASLGAFSLAVATEDLAALQVQGFRGQSAAQARRDRYECHNWAIEQSGETPVAAAANGAAANDAERRRAERIDRALMGAAIGAGVGGLAAAVQHEHSGQGVLFGAALGSVIGAATTGKARERETAEAEGPSDYLRALTACLEGRGYSVSLPSPAVSASR